MEEFPEPAPDIPPGHDADDFGWHDPQACYACLVKTEVQSDCRCAECCKRLLIEADVRDAEREPLIAQKGKPIYQDERLTASGQKEMIGYFLNGPNLACVFLDEQNLCSIYPTRPLICRLFDCSGEGREQLIDLGILERDDSAQRA
jgi:Fe-S-cluster containining protein